MRRHTPYTWSRTCGRCGRKNIEAYGGMQGNEFYGWLCADCIAPVNDALTCALNFYDEHGRYDGGRMMTGQLWSMLNDRGLIVEDHTDSGAMKKYHNYRPAANTPEYLQEIRDALIWWEQNKREKYEAGLDVTNY